MHVDHPEEAARRDGDLLRMAVVSSVEGRRCVVAAGELETGPIPWFVGRAGDTRRWSKVTAGEQGLLLCPEGDVEAGVFLPGVLSDAFPEPTTDDVEAVHFKDEAAFRYDPEAHVLTITLPGGGAVQLVAPAGVKVTGPVDIEGPLTVSQGVTAQGDVTGQGVSLHGHMHKAVQPGSGVSGPPA